MFRRILVFVTLLAIILISACDKGIAPGEPSGPVGFEGKVTFVGTWPDSIKRTHVVVFKNPILTSDDFFPPNLSFVVDSIPYRSSEYSFNSLEDNYIPLFQLAPGNYSYVVVAQSKTPDISLARKDWFVVGVYCLNGHQNNPTTLSILPGRVTTDVNIIVDFNNPPPQPPM